MNDEAGFLSHLAAHPEDETARGAYADWLDEHDRGEEAAKQRLMGPGFRALVGMDRDPVIHGRLAGYRFPGFCSESYKGHWKKNDETIILSSVLPDDWFNLVQDISLGPVEGASWVCRETVDEIITDAAIAFAKLPPERQAELLAYQPAGATT